MATKAPNKNCSKVKYNGHAGPQNSQNKKKRRKKLQGNGAQAHV
jgi:hypothetical protein